MKISDEMVERAIDARTKVSEQGVLRSVPFREFQRIEMRAALEAAVGEMVLVPREPTEAMMSAWFNGICNDGRTLAIDDDIRAAARQDWSVMIEAAS